MRQLRILIGDDVFQERFGRNTPLLNILIAMQNVFGRKEEGPIELKEGTDGTVVCEKTIGPFSLIVFKRVTTADELIAEANNDYDWIVTDYDYGRDDRDGGMRVIEAIKNITKPVKAVCTSTDDSRIINELQKKGMTYVLSTKLSGVMNKFELLGKQIAQHYLA